jgi:hypothetical protein
MITSSPPDPLENLDRSILRAHRLVQIFALTTLLSYVVWFWFVNRLPLAESGGNWGTFGDFIGGVLNPVVAYAAFYWLTQSVRLQKQELSETRLALRDAATSQAETAAHARTSVRLDALAALTNSITAEVSAVRLEMQFVSDQIARDPSRGGARTIEGGWLDASWSEYLKQKNEHVTQRLADQAVIEREVRDLLRQFQANAV